jgi:hypothetical protein
MFEVACTERRRLVRASLWVASHSVTGRPSCAENP